MQLSRRSSVMQCSMMQHRTAQRPLVMRSNSVCSPSRKPMCVVASAGLTRPAGEDTSSMDSGSHGMLGPFMRIPDAVVARGGSGFDESGSNMGGGSVLGAVLERNRVNIIMPTPPQQAPKLDDGGVGGGLGKNNHNGGGGGDGGGDDDDDYFGEEGDGEGDGSGGAGDGFFRVKIPELFDRMAIGAVLQEWYKTIADLPLFIRRSVEMGLYSSAQLVRFLSMDVRPSITRTVSRSLPTAWAREFVGRLIADPAFAQKLLIEQALAFTASMLHEWRTRGDAFKHELDLALINSMGLAAAVGATVWITAPSRAIGAVHKFPWQRMLSELPHCVFDASGPLRSYSAATRVGGFFASMAQLSAVGAATGALTSAASSLAVAAHKRRDPAFEPSVAVPDVARSSGGLGAFFALNANVRYQLLGGLDTYLFSHTSQFWSYVGLTAVARVASLAVGELSRPWWQGLPTETAASHHQRRPRVRKVKRRVVKKAAAPAATQQQQLVAGGDEQAAAIAAIAAAAAGAAAADAAATSSSGAAVEQLQQEATAAAAASSAAAAAALNDYAPISAADAAPVFEVEEYEVAGSEGASGAAEGSLEADVEGRLMSAPALMGTPEGLQQLVRQQSFSGSAMGEALRDAVVSEVAA